jgi:hypothetical protein
MASGPAKKTVKKITKPSGKKALPLNAVPEGKQPFFPQPTPTEEKIEESKYFTAVKPAAEERPKAPEMPYNYGEDKIVLMVRDPRWVHAYWEITEEKYGWARVQLGGELSNSKEILRVYDATSKPWKSFDITINSVSRSWYINVPEPGRTYIVDIGYLTSSGKFILLARSNAVTTPRERMSDVIDEEWMTIDFDRMYALSGGFGIGKSSGEIRKLMQKHLEMLRTSGWPSTSSSPLGKRPR